MWWIIIIIVAFIAIKFIIDMNKQGDAVSKQGGMQNKYKILIEHLLCQDSKCKVFETTKSSITLGMSNSGGSTIFILQQTFGHITIQWKVNSPIFGKHQLEWTFDEFGNQEQMYAKIENDILAYQSNVFSKLF